MTIATPQQYRYMLDRASHQGYALPAINVTSSQTLNAALHGFAEAESDGIIQVSVGGSAYWSGSLKNRVIGSRAFAAFAHEVASQYPNITVALHTDHCHKEYLDDWVIPLLEAEIADVQAGKLPLFQSHMWDGSTIALSENIALAKQLLARSEQAHTILELEVGAVGGEEDGHSANIDSRLYSTPSDAQYVVDQLGLPVDNNYMVAFTFGNVHGSYKPGKVKLKPTILRDIQMTIADDVEKNALQSSVRSHSDRSTESFPKPFKLVFHGGSGSSPSEIAEAVSYGVVKMNIDTDTQYAFTRPIAGHMFEHYSGVIKCDGEVGEKRYYDPRSWGAAAEENMAHRVTEACVQLGSAGNAIQW